MSLFLPNYFYDKIWDIPLSFLKENHFSCLLLDIDNTLTLHDDPTPHEKAVKWLEMVKKEGICAVVISNNIENRVSPFCEDLGVDFVCHAQKPLSKGVLKAARLTGIKKQNMLLIGDQIFTDVLCGKLSNVKTVLVTPFERETMPFFKVKRWFEDIILRKRR